MKKTGISRAMAVALSVALMGVAGCGSSPEAKKEEKAAVEKSISEGLAKDGLALKTVSCPADPPADKEGATWICDATDAQGTAGKIKVTKTASGISFAADGALVDMGLVGPAAEPILSQQAGKPVTVKCPKTKIFAKKDVKFTCDATHDGAAVKMEATLSDDTGKVSFTLPGVAAAPPPGDAPAPEGAKPDDAKADDKHE